MKVYVDYAKEILEQRDDPEIQGFAPEFKSLQQALTWMGEKTNWDIDQGRLEKAINHASLALEEIAVLIVETRDELDDEENEGEDIDE